MKVPLIVSARFRLLSWTEEGGGMQRSMLVCKIGKAVCGSNDYERSGSHRKCMYLRNMKITFTD